MKFSILVPIYNTETYLKKCINSILEQTYANFELILINDGSTDNCGYICDYYKSIDKRIKVIHKHNSGVSSTKNIGINNSIGEYIVFVDSDDYIEKNFLEVISKEIESQEYEMIFFGFKEETEDNTIVSVNNVNKNKYYKSEFSECITYLIDNNIFGYQCSKVINSKTIKENNIKFDENISLNEDLLFTFEVLKYTKNIKVLEFSPYHYVRRQESLTSNNQENILETNEYILERIVNYYKFFNVKDKERLILERSILSLFNICKKIKTIYKHKEISFKDTIYKCDKIINSKIFSHIKNRREYIPIYIKGRRKIPLYLLSLYKNKFLMYIFILIC
ncbi:glycosyltransferase family 2 protein [Clostridium perfringens]